MSEKSDETPASSVPDDGRESQVKRPYICGNVAASISYRNRIPTQHDLSEDIYKAFEHFGIDGTMEAVADAIERQANQYEHMASKTVLHSSWGALLRRQAIEYRQFGQRMKYQKNAYADANFKPREP